jgi:hypothetical protein
MAQIQNELPPGIEKTINEIKALVGKSRKGYLRENLRRQAFEDLVWLVDEMFMRTMDESLDFEISLSGYLDLYDKEFNELLENDLIGKYSHVNYLEDYSQSAKESTEEYIYNRKAKVDGKCFEIIKHLIISYRIGWRNGHLVSKIYYIKGQTEKKEKEKCEK